MGQVVDEKTLTEKGMDAPDVKLGRVLLLACGALAHEILALKRLNKWDHMDLQCLPAKYHLYPDKIPNAVEEAILKHQNDYETIFVVYADCGTGGLLQAKE